MNTPAKFARNGQEVGVYDLAELPGLLEQGIILATDHYWTSGMQSWVPVQDEITRISKAKRGKLIKALSITLAAATACVAAVLFLLKLQEDAKIAHKALEAEKAAQAEEQRIATEKADKVAVEAYENLKGQAINIAFMQKKFAFAGSKYSKISRFAPMIFSEDGYGIMIDRKKLAKNGGIISSNSPIIVVFVNELGNLHLESYYYGEKWVFHEAVESKNNKGFFKTPNAEFSDIIRKQSDGSVTERVSYSAEDSDRFIRSLVKSKEANPSVSFLDKNGANVGTIYLGTEYIAAIREAVALADLYKQVQEAKKLAIGAYRRKAKNGDAASLYMLAGLTNDEKERMLLLKSSSDLGYWRAMNEYAKEIEDESPKLSEQLKAKASLLEKEEESKSPK